MRWRALIFLLSKATVISLVIVIFSVVWAADLRVGTFNIRNFPENTARREGLQSTDVPRLLALLSAVNADLLAVQEIKDPALLQEIVSQVPGRDYTAVLSDCGGTNRQFLGFVFDRQRLQLLEHREIRPINTTGDGNCHVGSRPGVYAYLRSTNGLDFHVLVLHLKSGGGATDLEKRKAQWEAIERSLVTVDDRDDTDWVVLGDFNSTGFDDNTRQERDWLLETWSRLNLVDVAPTVACTSYFCTGCQKEAGTGPGAPGQLHTGLIDHVTVRQPMREFLGQRLEVHGHCADLQCQQTPFAQAPEGYLRVSDHCPLVLVLNDADLDPDVTPAGPVAGDLDCPIQGNRKSKIYHVPGGQFYGMISEQNLVCFASEEDAQAGGFRKSKR